MNKKLSIIHLVFIVAPFFVGCNGAVTAEKKNTASADSVSPLQVGNEKFNIDTAESIVTWEGSMVFGFNEEHIGYVHISKGELTTQKDQLVGGTVEIDMNTIEYKDKENQNTPVKHLKSPDYFDVEKFPAAAFVITGVESLVRGNIKVTGNLTIKGVTNPISFPAQLEVNNGIARADGKVVIDRTKWGIRYRSGKFYDNLADQTVADEIELHMKIVAKQHKDSLAKALAEISKEVETGTIYQSSSPHHNVLHQFTYLVAIRDFCETTLLEMRGIREANNNFSKELEGELLNAKAALTASKFTGFKIEPGLYELFLKQMHDRLLQSPLAKLLKKC